MKIEEITEEPNKMAQIEKVLENEDTWEIVTDRCLHFSIGKEHGFRPEVGMMATFWGRGFSVRGIALDEQVVYYRTPEEEDNRHQKWCAEREAKQIREFEEKGRGELDAQYDALPPIFQHRIDKFRRNNPEFRWKYEEYEMFVCTEAVKIADALKTPEKIHEWHELSYDEQRKQVPIADGHSGNTFGMACTLAQLYLTQKEDVGKMHGALAPLVGSEEYGCVPQMRKKTGE